MRGANWSIEHSSQFSFSKIVNGFGMEWIILIYNHLKVQYLRIHTQTGAAHHQNNR